MKQKRRLKVSVVVIAKNAEKTLRKCLSSLKKQDFKGYEVLLINDHSKDRTAEIARKFRIKVINQNEDERGVPDARNKGIKESKTEIIAFTDSDCIAPPNWLSRIYDYLDKHPEVDGVGGPMKPYSKGYIAECEGIYWNALQASAIFQTSNCAYWKKDLIDIGLFDRKYTSGSDADINIRLKKAGYNLKFLQNLIVLHKHRTDILKFMKHHFWYGRGRIQLIKKHPYWFNPIDRNILKIISIASLILIFLILSLPGYAALLIGGAIITGFFASSLRRWAIIKKITKTHGFLDMLKCWILFPAIDLANVLGMYYQNLK